MSAMLGLVLLIQGLDALVNVFTIFLYAEVVAPHARLVCIVYHASMHLSRTDCRRPVQLQGRERSPCSANCHGSCRSCFFVSLVGNASFCSGDVYSQTSVIQVSLYGSCRCDGIFRASFSRSDKSEIIYSRDGNHNQPSRSK